LGWSAANTSPYPITISLEILQQMAKIELTDSQGNKYSLEVTDGEMFRLFNITKLSGLVGINKYTLSARVCRQYPDGEYRSLVTALNK
jgi:hypothetical protein